MTLDEKKGGSVFRDYLKDAASATGRRLGEELAVDFMRKPWKRTRNEGKNDVAQAEKNKTGGHPCGKNMCKPYA